MRLYRARPQGLALEAVDNPIGVVEGELLLVDARMWESEVEAVLRAKDVPPNVIPVRPFEQTVRIITEFYSLAMQSDRPQVLISNTDIGLDSGTHYFTVAFSIVPK